jgi:hypothetical protein
VVIHLDLRAGRLRMAACKPNLDRAGSAGSGILEANETKTKTKNSNDHTELLPFAAD